MDPATASGLIVAEQVVSTTIEGGALAAYGLSQSTQPLTATFTRISSDAFLPRTNHSITVVNGQAYIFGGEEEPGKLAGDEVHIVSLPLKKAANERKPDYKVVPSLGEGEDGTVPGPRAGHSAVAVGGKIYIFGGRGEEQKAIEEKGRVWVFDTKTLGWSYVDPFDNGEVPDGRYLHGTAATEHPLPNTNNPSEAGYSEQIKSTMGKLPSLVGVGSSTSSRDPHGSLVIAGGQTNPDTMAGDVWIFNIAACIWSRLPQHPVATGKSAPTPAPSFALTQKGLYSVSSSNDVSGLGGEVHYLPLTKDSYYDAQSKSKTSLSSTDSKWTTTQFPANPLTPGPSPRRGAGLIPITTGNGREYLLYLLGEKLSPPKPKTEATNPLPTPSPDQANSPVFFSDTWSYQALPASPSAASIKDATRTAMGISTGEGTWAEVKIETVVEGETEGKSHPGPRGWFASCPIGKEINGAGLLIWGGVNGKGEVEGDGWVVSVR